MSRMTKTQWEDRHRRVPDKATLQRALWREVRRRMLEAGVIKRKPPKEKKEWLWNYDGRHGAVFAHTRSEARSEVKKQVGKLKLPLVLYVVADDSGAVSQ